ncbi:MAG: hypothetical protein ACRD5R_12305, partial [Candidatus Acidiferrales bacterium]
MPARVAESFPRSRPGSGRYNLIWPSRHSAIFGGLMSTPTARPQMQFLREAIEEMKAKNLY